MKFDINSAEYKQAIEYAFIKLGFEATFRATWTVNAKDRAAIETALDSSDLDLPTRAMWRAKMEYETNSGWFCPQSPEEMRLAIQDLQQGKKIRSFPRGG